MKKILSFDIGVRNLAYIILSPTNDSTKPYEILKWDIINLIEENQKCSYKDCESKDIKHFCSSFNEKIFFCKQHKGYHKTIETKYTDIINNIKESDETASLSRQDLKLKTSKNLTEICLQCKKNAKWLINNNNYCSIHKNSSLKRWAKEITLTKYTTAKCNTFTTDELKLSLINNLDKLPELLKVDEVCIENQPTLKNPKMKALSDSLYTYFLIRGIVDKNLNNSVNSFFKSVFILSNLSSIKGLHILLYPLSVAPNLVRSVNDRHERNSFLTTLLGILDN